MDVWALFSNKTAEKIIISSIPHKKDESGLIFRSTISNAELKKSVQRSITNTYHFLLTRFPDNVLLLEPLSICILGFSGGKVIGQSAELAFALAFISFLMERGILTAEKNIPHNIAATGTINDRFEVGEVKGLKEKILAAHEHGAELILYPASNSGDIKNMLMEDGDIRRLSADNKLQSVANLEDLIKILGLTKVVDDSPADRNEDTGAEAGKPYKVARDKQRVKKYSGFKASPTKKILLSVSWVLAVLLTIILWISFRNGGVSTMSPNFTLASGNKQFPTQTAGTSSHADYTVLPALTSAVTPIPVLVVTPVPTYANNTPVSTPVKIQSTVAAPSSRKILLFNDGNVKSFGIKQDGRSTIKLSEDKNGHSGKAVRIKYNLCEGGFVSAVYKLQGVNNIAPVKREKIIFYYKGSNDNAPNSLELKLSCFNSGSRTFYFTLNNVTKADNGWIKKEIDYNDFNPRLNENDIINLEKVEFCIFNDFNYGDKAGEGEISICDMEIS